jgi:hypothetical protein
LLAERHRDNHFGLPAQSVEIECDIPGQGLAEADVAAILKFVKGWSQRLLKNSTRPERKKRGSCGSTLIADPCNMLRLTAYFAQGLWRRGELSLAVCAPAFPKFSAASAAGWE